MMVGLLVLVLPATVALASNDRGADRQGTAGSQGSDNSEADITVTFEEDCSGFHVESSKEISFVSTNTEDANFTYHKFEGGDIESEDQDFDGDDPDGSDKHDFSYDQDDPYKSIVVKSGTSREVFDCPDGGGPGQPGGDDPECDDGTDNDGDDKVDHPDDPGCQAPDDDDERDGDGNGDPCADKGGDTDGDGVCDDEDECPTEPGPKKNKGCPVDPDPCDDKGGDTDGDGVCDDDDECPTEPGPKKNKGCPVDPDPCDDKGGDTDGDGVCDDDDECPTEPGPADNNGCPVDPDPCDDKGGDTDGDGVCDDDDACPNEAGPADNDGCPVEENLCTAAADDPGLPLTEDTLGQTLWDSGLDALSPLTEDPERNGALSGPIGDGGTDTPLEPVTDEVACAIDLLIDEELGGDL